MASGDHVFVHRLGYTHHGVDAGDGTVIHYTGEIGQKTDAVVRRTDIEKFAKGCAIHVRQYGVCDETHVTLKRATSRLGEAKYRLFFNNCEHFATWCKTGQEKSEQVKNTVTSSAGAVAGGSAVAAGLGTVSATGAAAGLSGPGIMSGLATVGSFVGGGAVAGIVIVGAAPATMTTAAMWYVLKDDVILHETEREARRVGRLSTIAGAVGGTAASVGTVAAVGASGLSAAGITSGLAAVGGVVGGGMVAGVVVTAAAPAVAAAGVGYGTYRIWKHWRKGRTPKAKFADVGFSSTQSFSHVIAAEVEYYTTGPQQGRPPDGKFPAGTKVNIVQQAGSYTLVRSEGGVEAFVTSDALKESDP